MFRRNNHHDQAAEFRAAAAQLIASAAEPASPAPVGAAPGAGETGGVDLEIPAELHVPPAGDLAGSMMRYWAPLTVDGVVVSCSECGVYRDWLVLSSGDKVWVRCRSGHDTPVPGLDAAWYERTAGPVEGLYTSRESGETAFGYDGTFAGVIL
ncbi:hypothetical protein OTB20_36085 [Streptomyces sp. H27-H1]|uniref:hypothetical protein n=1 Tax=Streptomyces sp. H27-H1 TaxID=2996461 RepID=UPI00226EE26A|nr:hypothetical protein [Streptomyces sp. H27-H1]MCY0931512.1 hypothetical protein [Streptomyces sp. H27-H1]